MKSCIFFADGLEEVEGLTVVDMFRRVGIPISIVSISGSKTITGSHNIKIEADALFNDIDYAAIDMLILPGGLGGVEKLGAFSPLCQLLKEFNEQQKLIAAICAAPSILGTLGLLKNKNATCYPGLENQLSGAKTKTEKVVIDGTIITSRGMGTSIEFAVALIQILKDKKTADELLKKIVFTT